MTTTAKKPNRKGLDFIIDKLTNSVENVVTGESFQTEVSLVSEIDLKPITKRNKWDFDWKTEQKQIEREIYKLTIANSFPAVIHGLVSIEIKPDHVFMHLIENAPFNKGKNKMYNGVAGNLIAFACKLSYQRGYFGEVSFIAKTNLIKHYQEKLGANLIYGNVLYIPQNEAVKLIKQYFKNLII